MTDNRLALEGQAVGGPPVVITISSEDSFAYPLLVSYARMCREFGMEGQAQEMSKIVEEFRLWQEANPTRVHLPNNKYVPQLGVKRPASTEELAELAGGRERRTREEQA